ncbi:hypothetical protein ACJ4V0_20810 [Phreatobacter sp. HK31-P]
MFRRRALAAVPVLLGLGWAVLPSAPEAQDWNFSTVANISATMGVSDGRLCLGEASRQDLGCPTYAPYVDGATGNVGIKTTNPSSTLHLYDTGDVSPGGSAGLTIGPTNGTNLGIDANEIMARANGSASTLFLNNDGGAVFINGSTSAPRVGIGLVATPSASLHISGTLRLASGGEACDANRTGAIRYTAGDFSVCRNGSSWETLTAIAGGGTPDRITSGTSAVVVNSATSTVSITLAGVTRSAFNSSGVGLGMDPWTGYSMTASGTAIVIGADSTLTNAAQLQLRGSTTSGAADLGGGLSFHGYDGTSTRIFASVQGLKENSTVGNTEAYLRFSTRQTASLSERMRITSTGNVGISTTNPNAKLEVVGRVSASVVQVNDDGAGCTTGTLGTICEIACKNHPLLGWFRVQ